MKKRTTDIIFIIIGAFLFALGVNLFVIPNEFGEGGVTGITIITYYFIEWSPGLVNLILNAILLIVGYKFLNKITTDLYDYRCSYELAISSFNRRMDALLRMKCS
ncbi:YitT family protein [Bacillus cereus]|uniref:YitT family protein n=1 Tax=Bacillus cereus TaxID=1396 RepID=UPI003CF3DAAD